MAKQKYSQEEFEVFRQYGYDGASMEILAESTGLRKSSLYHRFPGGKEEMAEAVLQSAAKWARDHIVAVVNSEIPREVKLEKIMNNIFELYDGGTKTCILRSMLMGTGLTRFEKAIASIFHDLQYGFRELAKAYGKSEAEAEMIAVDGIIKVQGSLILGKAFGDPNLFKQQLAQYETVIKH